MLKIVLQGLCYIFISSLVPSFNHEIHCFYTQCIKCQRIIEDPTLILRETIIDTYYTTIFLKVVILYLYALYSKLFFTKCYTMRPKNDAGPLNNSNISNSWTNTLFLEEALHFFMNDANVWSISVHYNKICNIIFACVATIRFISKW